MSEPSTVVHTDSKWITLHKTASYPLANNQLVSVTCLSSFLVMIQRWMMSRISEISTLSSASGRTPCKNGHQRDKYQHPQNAVRVCVPFTTSPNCFFPCLSARPPPSQIFFGNKKTQYLNALADIVCFVKMRLTLAKGTQKPKSLVYIYYHLLASCQTTKNLLSAVLSVV